MRFTASVLVAIVVVPLLAQLREVQTVEVVQAISSRHGNGPTAGARLLAAEHARRDHKGNVE